MCANRRLKAAAATTVLLNRQLGPSSKIKHPQQISYKGEEWLCGVVWLFPFPSPRGRCGRSFSSVAVRKDVYLLQKYFVPSFCCHQHWEAKKKSPRPPDCSILELCGNTLFPFPGEDDKSGEKLTHEQMV